MFLVPTSYPYAALFFKSGLNSIFVSYSSQYYGQEHIVDRSSRFYQWICICKQFLVHLFSQHILRQVHSTSSTTSLFWGSCRMNEKLVKREHVSCVTSLLYSFVFGFYEDFIFGTSMWYYIYINPQLCVLYNLLK